MQGRREDGSLRQLVPAGNLVDFSSNDYLGFAAAIPEDKGGDPHGSTGSRLISGNHPLYDEVERKVREYHLAEAALIFNSGYDTNLGLLSAILQRHDIIFYDQRVHASIRDGISLGKGRAFNFAHNDLDSLKGKVRQVVGNDRPAGSEVYVVTESVYSMEGDGPDLKELALYCRDNGFRLIVDEAHATGVLGPGGRGEVAGTSFQDDVFARVITFGKALGCHGAAVLGSSRLREYLINFSRSLIYTTALPPSGLRAILNAYTRLEGPLGQSARESLAQNIRIFRTLTAELGLSDNFRNARAAIWCCEIGGNLRVKALAQVLRDAGFDVKPILSPTVPPGGECLRFSLHAYNTAAQIREVLTILAGELRVLKDG